MTDNFIEDLLDNIQGQGSVNFSCQGTDGKYFQLC